MLERFLNMYESELTKANYTGTLNLYLKMFCNEGSLVENVEKYFTEKREYEEDIREFFSSILSRPPKTISVYMSIIKTFFIDNDVEFSERFWKELRRKKKGSGAVTQDKILSKDELKSVLMHMNINYRAFYLSLASSGMRFGELLKLMKEDIDFNARPCLIRIRAEYTKSGRRARILSSENLS